MSKLAGKHLVLPTLDLATAAYLAGLIDGEGCIGIYRKKPNGTRRKDYHQLLVSVAMRDSESVTFMAGATAAWGSKKTARLVSTGVMHEVRVYGQRAAALLVQLLPYLQVKKEQARLAIEFYKQCDFSRAGVPVTEEEIAKRVVFASLLKELKHGTPPSA